MIAAHYYNTLSNEVGVSVTFVSAAKTAEPIDMPIYMDDSGEPK